MSGAISQLLIKILKKLKKKNMKVHNHPFHPGYVSISAMYLYPAKIAKNRGMTDTGT